MIIIGFSDKTSKTVVRLLCGHFKHCVIIEKNKRKFVLHQFVKRNNVQHIVVTEHGIAQLELNGWVFIYIDSQPKNFNPHKLTCVNYVKHAMGLRNIWIQTPNALYKYIKKNLT